MAGGAIGEESSAFDTCRRVDELGAHALKRANRLAKLSALERIAARRSPLGEPDGERRDADATRIEHLQGIDEPLPFTPSICDAGTRHCSKMTSLVSLARIPSLSSFFPARRPFVSRSMKAEMPRLPLRAIGDGHHHHHLRRVHG